MKKSTFFTGLLTLMFSASAMAQDLTINADEFVIEEGGVLDKVTGCIQNTSAETTRIYLGEVDFGETGDKYKAAGIRFANGWSTDGWAILHAGADYESSKPFTQIQIDETGGYQAYYVYADTMSYVKGPNQDGVFEGIAVPGTTYVKPTGVQKVWLTFVGGNGNIRSVVFLNDQLQPEDLVQDGDGRQSWWGCPTLRFPSEKPGYAEISVKKLSTESTPAVPMGDDSEFKDVRLDGDTWGWTIDGFIADYGEVDFGTGEYDQVITYLKHSNDPNALKYFEIYIDEVKDENMIASVWGGIHLNNVYPIAQNIESITGTHKVLVKWKGGSLNLQAVEFSKGANWEEGLTCGIQIVDQLPSENAFRVKFEGCLEGFCDPWAYDVLAKGQYESAGNIGYTKNGTVIEFFTQEGNPIDFGNGEYKTIIVDHACDKTWLGEVEDASFDFYLDLDPEYSIPKETWDTDLASILDGHEPIARVRIQGTTNWSIRKHTAGAITGDLSGEHGLYMVYNIKNDASAGANVFNIYFDKEELTGVSASTVTGVNVYAANGQIVVNTTDPVKVNVYALSGVNMTQTVASAGMNSFDAAPGFYIVKVTDENGAIATYKVLVK